MVRQPHFRDELLRILTILSDSENQDRTWGTSAPTGNGNFVVSMHFLLDDTALADEPAEEIGDILNNHEEAKAIKRVTDSISEVFDKIGNNLSAEKYIAHSDWAKVTVLSQEALNGASGK
jgi:hypothetical protein